MRYAEAGVVLSAALIAACASKESAAVAAAPKLDQAAASAAISQRMDQFGAAVLKRDAAAVADMFADDATWVLPDASSFKGKDAIKAGATAFFANFDSITAPSTTVDRVVVVSDSEIVSFATGKFTLWMKGKKAGETHLNPSADYWKKGADGNWRVVHEVNGEGPANPPPPAPAAKKS
jgi:uncharacterized protein (TIGR02246 family)